MEFSNFFKKSQIKFVVEAFKGALEKEALVAQARILFDEENEIKEVVAVGDLNKADKAFKKILDDMMFEIKAKDFDTSYLVAVNKKGDVSKVIAVITESVSDELTKLFDENQQIVRIQKN